MLVTIVEAAAKPPSGTAPVRPQPKHTRRNTFVLTTEKKAARVSVPKSVPLRTAVQLFICVLFGMANMICYGHYKDSDMRGEDDWWQWPTHGWPPKASFQLITYVNITGACRSECAASKAPPGWASALRATQPYAWARAIFDFPCARAPSKKSRLRPRDLASTPPPAA